MSKYTFNRTVLERLWGIEDHLDGGFKICEPYNVGYGYIFAPIKCDGMRIGYLKFLNGKLVRGYVGMMQVKTIGRRAANIAADIMNALA